MLERKNGPPMVMIPLDTEVTRLHEVCIVGTDYDRRDGVIIALDIRRHDWRDKLKLPPGSCVRWENIRTVDVRDLSCFMQPIRYRITFGDGIWRDESGQRHYFGVGKYLPGIDLKRGVTTVTLRAAIMLSVVACMGLRVVSWLLDELFHVKVGKSSLARWLVDVCVDLPDGQAMAMRLNADRSITEAHLGFGAK